MSIVERQLTEESRRSDFLDSSLASLRASLEERESFPMGASSLDIKITTAENRLHEVIIRFNQAIAGNVELKDQIELIRKERDTYSLISTKLQNELNETLTRVAAIAQKTESDNNARETAIGLFNKLKAQADREHAEFEKEWSELARLIENDRRMKEFLKQKEMHRSVHTTKPAQPKVDINHQTDDLESAKARLRSIESKFDTIRLATGVSSMSDMLLSFVETDKRNFSLFNRISECNQAIAHLEDKKNTVNTDLRQIGDITQRSNRFLALHADESRRSRMESQADEMNSKFSALSKFLSSIKQAIQGLVERVFPNGKRLDEYLSSSVLIPNGSSLSEGLSDSNLVFFLAAVETRVNELVISYRGKFLDAKRGTGSFATKVNQRKSIAAGAGHHRQAPLHSGPIVLSKLAQFKIPSINDEDYAETSLNEDHDSVLRVIPRDELVARTLAHIRRNQSRSAKR